MEPSTGYSMLSLAGWLADASWPLATTGETAASYTRNTDALAIPASSTLAKLNLIAPPERHPQGVLPQGEVSTVYRVVRRSDHKQSGLQMLPCRLLENIYPRVRGS